MTRVHMNKQPMACMPACLWLLLVLLLAFAEVPDGQPLQAYHVDVLVNEVKPILDPEGRILASWVRANDCSQWLGLLCDQGGNVTQINLPEAGLTGSIPESITELSYLVALNLGSNLLSGQIPRSIGRLSLLETLDLGHNHLGGAIPASAYNLSRLQFLNLSHNNLSGQVGSLSGLPSLEHLDLRSNSIDGPFPPFLETLAGLKVLDLSSNGFQGEIFPAVTSLSGLTHLGLAELQLGDQIPSSISGLQGLSFLNLSHNAFGGSIPPELGDLGNLVYVDLSANQLTGGIPASLWDLASVSHLVLENNSLSGDLHKVSPNLRSLRHLSLASNRFSGSFPTSYSRLGHLELLNLEENRLEGSLPESLADFVNLTHLELGGNRFSGSIPASLGELSKLKFLSLGDNSLVGPIPPSITKLTNLEFLALGYNALNGTIPDISPLSKLRVLILLNNELTGGVPSSLSRLQSLEAVLLDSNNLGGTFLTDLSGLRNLSVFSCSKCHLIGPLPSDIAQGGRLSYLDLSNNDFAGEIPASMLSAPALQFLDLSVNRLTGSIPDTLTSGQSLRFLYLRSNQLRGELPVSLAKLPNLTLVDLGWNMLTGGIPALYGTLGGGSGGKLLNMSLQSNLLDGTLPAELGNLTNLRSLELNNNSFTSTLPAELGRLSDLLVMDLSNNSFFGSIPATYSNLTNLQELSLAACGISKVVPDLSKLDSLVKLDLSFNRLEGPLPSLPSSGDLLTIDLESNFLTGNLSFGNANLGKLQALLLGSNFLEGPIPESLAPAAPNLSILSLVDNELTLPVPSSLLNWTTLTLQLYLNPAICSLAWSNSSLWKPCQPPSSLQYSAAPFCPTLECNNNNTANPALYLSPFPRCVCAAPLTATLLLESPVFVLFTTNTSQRLEAELAAQLGVEDNQVQVASATSYGGSGWLVLVQIFPTSGVLEESTVSKVSTQLQNITLSFYLGPAQLLSVTNPPPPSTTGLSPPSSPSAKGGGGVATWVVLVVVIGTAVLAAVSGIGLLLWFRPAAVFGRRHGMLRQTSFALRVQDHFVKAIPLELVMAATDNFSDEAVLGSGGYGTVYKGTAPNGQMWAVKRAKTITERGLQAFQNEVDVISKMSHNNLVRLLGYCDEANEQILIYDFVPNGSLRGRLKADPKKTPPLTFEQRIDIALGSAEGLRYLHSFAQPTIIHRDVKSENILLDANWQAKIADFGLLKDNPLGGSQDEAVNTRLAGTPGYIDPQYYSTFQVTAKSDVYSFGVVLLELITARGPLLRELPSTSAAGEDPGQIIKLSDWVDFQHFVDYVDPLLEYPPKPMGALLELTFRCLEERSANRPDMEEVALTLGQIKASLREESYELVKTDSESQSASGATLSSPSKVTSGVNFETAPIITTLRGR